MITADKSVVTYAGQHARDAAGVIAQHEPKLDIAGIAKALARAYDRGTHTTGRVVITHTGYATGTAQFDAATAVYRLTIGRIC